MKTLTVKVSGGNSPVDTTYFYPDGERLINTSWTTTARSSECGDTRRQEGVVWRLRRARLPTQSWRSSRRSDAEPLNKGCAAAV